MIILQVNDHGKPLDQSISRYNFDQEISTIGIPFPLGVGQAVGTSSTPEPARLPTSVLGIKAGEHQMPGSHLRFVRTLDFGVLDGLAARAAAEIRAAEDVC